RSLSEREPGLDATVQRAPRRPAGGGPGRDALQRAGARRRRRGRGIRDRGRRRSPSGPSGMGAPDGRHVSGMPAERPASDPRAWTGERQADTWVGWARTPGHDAYWSYRDAFFDEIVPPPGTRTLEIGCGEGRVSRDLAARGHHVTGIDLSPTLIRH